MGAGIYAMYLHCCCCFSFVGAMLAGICSGLTCDLSIKAGLNAAFLSLGSATAISQELSPGLLEEETISKWAPWGASNI